MYSLKNSDFTVTISPKGAELQSILDKNGREWLWQGNPDIWSGQAPLLFPVIGRLKDECYGHNGKTYKMNKHGFAREMDFEVLSNEDTSICFRLSDTAKTRECYPFSFDLEVTFQLEGNKLHKKHRVTNKGQEKMYYELGGHDAYNLCFSHTETMVDCHFSLPKEKSLSVWDFDENVMLIPEKREITLENGLLTVKPSDFSLDCFILEGLKERSVSLQDGKGNTRISMEFSDFPILTLWTIDKAEDTNYVCIEPWTTLPDGIFMGRDLKDKQGVRCLNQGEQEEFSFTTTFYLD